MNAKTALTLAALLAIASFEGAQTPATSGPKDPHLTKAIELRGEAAAKFDSGDYDGAAELAREAKAELALISRAAPAAALSPLPASYTVRRIPGNRDSLYKIAGYPFIYGDGEKWYKIFDANRSTLKHPENEDLILPGEVLVIPSIAGEVRSGEWSPEGTYPSFAAK